MEVMIFMSNIKNETKAKMTIGSLYIENRTKLMWS